MSGLVAVLLVVALLASGPGRLLLPEGGEHTPHQDRPAVLYRLRPVLAPLALLGAWAFLGGVVGLAAGAVAGVISWRVLSSVEAPGAVRRRRELDRDLPMAVHLLAAALRAGAAPVNALHDVAASMPGAVAGELGAIHRRLALGTDPVTVWSDVNGVLLPLGRCMARAYQTGASVVTAVERLAEELQAGGRQRRDALARTVEVRAAAPLGLCFLPAFLLLGVVPMVVGIFSSVRLYG